MYRETRCRLANQGLQSLHAPGFQRFDRCRRRRSARSDRLVLNSEPFARSSVLSARQRVRIAILHETYSSCRLGFPYGLLRVPHIANGYVPSGFGELESLSVYFSIAGNNRFHSGVILSEAGQSHRPAQSKDLQLFLRSVRPEAVCLVSGSWLTITRPQFPTWITSRPQFQT